MKKICIILLIILLSAAGVYAQQGPGADGPVDTTEASGSPTVETVKQSEKSDKASEAKEPTFYMGGFFGIGTGFLSDSFSLLSAREAGAGFAWDIGLQGWMVLSKFFAFKFEMGVTGIKASMLSVSITPTNNVISYNMFYLQTSAVIDLGGYTPFVGFYLGFNLSTSESAKDGTDYTDNYDKFETPVNFGLVFSPLTFTYTTKTMKFVFSFYNRISFTNVIEKKAGSKEGILKYMSVHLTVSILFGM